MRSLKRALSSVVALLLLATALEASAQRPLCSQLPELERARARAAGLCRNPAPIIDVAPKAAPDAVPLIAVPSVVGMNFDNARNRLARFTIQRSYRAAAEPGGTVLAQSPMAPATLPAGAPVGLVLSDGSLVRVPRVTGVNINDARQRLQQDIDLRAQPNVVTSALRVGTVIEQQPPEGTLVKRGSVVRLQVSAGAEGPELIDVPNVVGMPFDRAKARLARFTIQRAERTRDDKSNQAPEGQVVEQTPRAATRAIAGSVIVLTVSSTPRALIEVFEMPNVIGRSFTDATRMLGEFKVTRTEVESTSARDRIVAQKPAAGSTLMPGEAVSLQVSTGPAVGAADAASSKGAGKDVRAANDSDAGSWRAILAIGAGVVLGLIAGALLMRHWLRRRQAVVTAAPIVAPVSPAAPIAPRVSTVDILLEEEPQPVRLPDQLPQTFGSDSQPADPIKEEEEDGRQKTDQST